MPRPRVTLHNLTSLDGRLDGFTPDVELYYETAARLPHQAVLTGSGTLLAAAAVEGIDLSGVDGARGTGSPPADASRPWLVIVDSAGRVSRLDWLRRRPVWRDVLVLCSETTPAGHLERLQRTGVEHLVLGERHGSTSRPHSRSWPTATGSRTSVSTPGDRSTGHCWRPVSSTASARSSRQWWPAAATAALGPSRPPPTGKRP